MKLSYPQLAPHLAKQLAPIYIISGDDPILKNEAIQLIRKTASANGFSARFRLRQNEKLECENLHGLLYACSFLAEKKLIELDCRDSLPDKTVKQVLEQYAAKPVEDNIVLIDMGKLDSKAIKAAWLEKLVKVGVLVTIWPLPATQLPQWILTRAQKYKLRLQYDAAQFLAAFVEGNLIAAAQALEKLYLLQIKEAITVETIQHVLVDESRFSIFDLTESLVAGNAERSLRILTTLMQEGVEPTIVLWSITRELRLLAELAIARQTDTSYASLWQKHRIFAQRQNSIRQWLSTHSETDCWHYLKRASDIDHILKGAAPGHPWQALQLFCCEMTGQKILCA